MNVSESGNFIGRPFVKPLSHCLSCPVCLSVCLSVCNFGVLWPNGWTDPDKTWQAGRPRLWPRCVRWGPSHPLRKGHSPQFSANVCCGQTAAWIKMKLFTEVGLGPGHIVLDGSQFPLPKGAQLPQFSAHICCVQMA